MISLILFVTISSTFSGLQSAEGIALGYRTPLSQLFERLDVDGSNTIVDFKAPKDNTKLVRKRILDTSIEGSSPQSKEIENSRSLEAFDLDSFWIEENYYSLSYSYSYSYSFGAKNKKEAHTKKDKSNAASTFDLDSFWEEEEHYAFSLSYSYSYSYSYDSSINKGSHEITDHSVTTIPEYDSETGKNETSAESEAAVLTDVETVPGNSNNIGSTPSLDTPDISLGQSSNNEEITVMPSVVSVKADSDDASSLVTPKARENDTAIVTNKSLIVEAVIADSSSIEGISFLAKTVIGVGIGFTAVVALLTLKKRQLRSLN